MMNINFSLIEDDIVEENQEDDDVVMELSVEIVKIIFLGIGKLII